MIAGDAHVTDWLQLIRAEYLEIPGLRLTKAQVERLWNLDEVVSTAILAALVDAKFLKRMPRDVYVRADLGCC